MSKKPVKLTKDERRTAALTIAVKLAQKCGARWVSVATVAAKQGVTAPLLFHIFESREGFYKAIVKQAKRDGVVLPEGAPTKREQRVINRKAKPVEGKKLNAKLVLPKPLKPLAKPAAKVTPNAASKKVAALLKPKPKPLTAVQKAAKVERDRMRKPLTAAQKAAKSERDRARRAPPVVTPTTPAGKFKALPKPFEASIAAVVK